jgi:hypothetical protein
MDEERLKVSDWIANLEAHLRVVAMPDFPTFHEAIYAYRITEQAFATAAGVSVAYAYKIFLGQAVLPDDADFASIADLFDTDFVAIFTLADRHNRAVVDMYGTRNF